MKTQLKVLGKFDKDKMLKIPAHLGMSEVTVKDGKIPKKKKIFALQDSILVPILKQEITELCLTFTKKERLNSNGSIFSFFFLKKPWPYLSAG